MIVFRPGDVRGEDRACGDTGCEPAGSTGITYRDSRLRNFDNQIEAGEGGRSSRRGSVPSRREWRARQGEEGEGGS